MFYTDKNNLQNNHIVCFVVQHGGNGFLVEFIFLKI